MTTQQPVAVSAYEYPFFSEQQERISYGKAVLKFREEVAMKREENQDDFFVFFTSTIWFGLQ